MFDSFKKLFNKTFTTQKEEHIADSKKNSLESSGQVSSLESAYNERSSESVIKKTQRNLKYRR